MTELSSGLCFEALPLNPIAFERCQDGSTDSLVFFDALLMGFLDGQARHLLILPRWFTLGRVRRTMSLKGSTS